MEVVCQGSKRLTDTEFSHKLFQEFAKKQRITSVSATCNVVKGIRDPNSFFLGIYFAPNLVMIPTVIQSAGINIITFLIADRSIKKTKYEFKS